MAAKTPQGLKATDVVRLQQFARLRILRLLAGLARERLSQQGLAQALAHLHLQVRIAQSVAHPLVLLARDGQVAGLERKRPCPRRRTKAGSRRRSCRPGREWAGRGAPASRPGRSACRSGTSTGGTRAIETAVRGRTGNSPRLKANGVSERREWRRAATRRERRPSSTRRLPIRTCRRPFAEAEIYDGGDDPLLCANRM